MAKNTSPPRAAEWLLKRLTAINHLFDCTGDFREEYARIQPGRTAEAVNFLREEWEARVPTHPFSYSFMDDTIDQFYRTEKRMGGLFNIFTGLAVIIACLGLFGLAAFTAERRNKEIGIRKTLGAGVPSIVALLSREFTKWVLIAGMAAAPLSCLVMNGWLNRYTYRISIGWSVPVLAVALALGAALVTVGYQAVHAGLADPVTALRDE